MRSRSRVDLNGRPERVQNCPLDCVDHGGRSPDIHHEECVDWDAPEPVSPVETIYYEDDPSDALGEHLVHNTHSLTAPPAHEARRGSSDATGVRGPLTVDPRW
jgi:NAD-dependent dihydropyrimidine dehydrogenase PreA subunit